MTSVFASRRRAEEFHSLVEAPAPGGPQPVGDARLEEFLAIVASLRAVPDAAPRPAFVASLRDDLMAAADTMLVPATDDRLTLPARNPRRDRRIAVAVGSLALVGAGTSMAVAAQSALPGEVLYPLKRVLEDAETGVASSPDAKAQTLLDSATSRLSEVRELGEGGDLSQQSSAVSTNFVDFADQANRATDYILGDYAESGDRGLVRELRDFTGASMATLEELQGQVPDSARDELAAAVDTVAEIDARARQACPSCGGAGVDQIPPVLLSSATTDAPVVVIPGATVRAGQSDDERRQTDGRGGDDTRSGGGVASLTDPLVDATQGDGDADSGGSGSGPTDPLGALTDDLTNDTPAANDPDGGDAGGTVKDTLDGAKKAVDDTKQAIDDATQQVEDTVDQLGDSLLGN